MSITLEIQWDIEEGREADFRASQRELCAAMHDHPGVICYHVDYPSDRVSRWCEVYANDDSFQAHVANERAKDELGAVIDAGAKITCQCRGEPDDATREVLAGFGTTHHDTAEPSFVLDPTDRGSPV